MPPSHWAHDVSAELDRIVMLLKALARDKEDRYQNASALGSDLRQEFPWFPTRVATSHVPDDDAVEAEPPTLIRRRR